MDKMITKRRARIAGCGKYVPETVVKSEELEERLSLPAGWVEMHCGVKERRFAKEGELPSDFAVRAAKAAFESAGCGIDDIDLIIFASTGKDRTIPATSAIIQYKLGAKKYIPTIDLNSVCVSFLFGFDIARLYIEHGIYNNVLVVSAELCSRVLNWKDKNSAILFGDAAAAVVLSFSSDNQESEVMFSYFATDGSKSNEITIKGGGIEYLPHKTFDHPELNMFEMSGLASFRNSMNVANLLFDTLFQGSKLGKDDYKCIVFHQANLPALKKFIKKVNIPLEKWYIDIDKYGNTASASIPLALCEAIEDKTIKRGDKIIMAAVGAGFSWGGCCLIY